LKEVDDEEEIGCLSLMGDVVVVGGWMVDDDVIEGGVRTLL
jgi:hypothetical protein